MENSHKIVTQLVEDFRVNEKAFLSPTYQESQVRQDFIDKFFTALGWDVTHAYQKNPYQQEVKIENKVTMGTSQRRADYAFAVSPNYESIKFFVEAKKPSRNLANADDYFQTIRYAWNSRTHISVLTDFEEFHILDCRYKPNIKDVLDRKIASYHYADYTNEDTFAKIYHLFSRESVLTGSLDLFVSKLQKKMAKESGKLQPVDDAFLEDLDEYRVILAKAFKKTNEQLQGEELTEAVQRTIDRLVFIRFLEDKGIEDRRIIGLHKHKSSWQGFLTLCKGLEPKYNGLVFKPHRILDSGEFNAPDDKAFAGICESISDPSSPYDFNQIPISILGSIYERFLGKVVHATDKRVKIEDKPEVKKAGGVFYTPEYIVRYIVKETVGKLIERKTPTEISKMTFADIACGSGSFLIQVYNELLEYHVRYYTEHLDDATDDDVFFRDGILRLGLKKKKAILLNNIYGVDIDYQATEVTQLSLYLKMLEHATMQEAHQFGMFKERILPDLRGNIVCGNSLIALDIRDGQLFADVNEGHLKPMNFNDAFPIIAKRGGFDAVVGNPPYVRMEEFKGIKIYLKNKYEAHDERSDLYAYFIEQGQKLLRTHGRFGMIVSNKFLRANYGYKLREFIRNNVSIERIIDFAGLPVFIGATVRTIILLTVKSKNNKPAFEYFPPLPVNEFELLTSGASDLQNSLHGKGFEIRTNELEKDVWAFSNGISSDIITKLQNDSVTLSNYCQGKICRGIVSGLTEAFVIDENTRQTIIQRDPTSDLVIKPFLNGRDVRRYSINSKKQYIIYTHHGFDINKYPAIEEYLLTFKPKLLKRATNQPWYELQQPQLRFVDFMERPKIIFPDIATESRFALDRDGYYGSNTTYFIANDDPYLLGLLNSKIGNFYFSTVCAGLEGKKEIYLRFFGQYLEGFPVKLIDTEKPALKIKHDCIVNLVEQITNVKEQQALAKTEAELNRLGLLYISLDRQIDESVYALYGLTEDEIQIIEKPLNER